MRTTRNATAMTETSEAGPSAAEEAEMTIARWMEWDQGRSVARMREEIRAALDRVAAEAKRSAHLEDARAGCYFCGRPETYPPAVRNDLRGIVRWRHVDGEGMRLCERPEVWDALSLPPGKPSGTIKSTASELPDGKTR